MKFRQDSVRRLFPSGKIEHRCRFQHSESEGLCEKERDLASGMTLITDGQVLTKNKLDVSASLGDHVSLVLIATAKIRAEQHWSSEDRFSLHFGRIALDMG